MSYKLLPAISSSYLLTSLDFAKKQGVSSKLALEGTSIANVNLKKVQEEVSMVNLGDYQKMIENTAAKTNKPIYILGFEAGLTFNISSHGKLGFAGIHCHNLDEALNHLIRFVPLASPLLFLNYYTTDDEAIIEIELQDFMPDTTKTYLLTFFLANLQKMAVELLGATTVENATAPRVEINRHLKLDQEKWFGEGLPPAEIDFNSEKTRVIFSREIAEMELPSANAFASQSATDVCELHLQQLLNEEDIVAKILLMLEETDGDFPSMESIAKELCLSPRTLHRHLKARNCNFRQIVSTVKMERARKLLIKDELSITEIAFQLGYTDAANFSNAFKRAHGLAPSQIKNQIKSQLKDHVRQIQYV